MPVFQLDGVPAESRTEPLLPERGYSSPPDRTEPLSSAESSGVSSEEKDGRLRPMALGRGGREPAHET